MEPSRIVHVAGERPRGVRGWFAAVCGVDARSLALFRIALGAILVADCLLRSRDFGAMFTPDGIFPPAAVRACHADATAWSLAFLNDAAWWNAVVLAIEGLAGALLAVGWCTRAATIVAWAAVLSVVRRTFPAANGGDDWLICLLFWSMFIPLGGVWSVDAARRRTAPPRPLVVRSAATAALLGQVAVVYLVAGLAKCNGTWTSGVAVAHALSVHDHGSALGAALVAHAGLAWIWGPAGWLVLLLEIGGAVTVLACPAPRMRLAIMAAFMTFHALIWLTMSVGLFAPIGLAAWLPFLPGEFWERRAAGGPRQPAVVGLGRLGSVTCAACIGAAAVGCVGPLAGWFAAPVALLVNLTGLRQDWRMFAAVPPLEQWVCGRAELADGGVVDILRGGAACSGERPAGGFVSLPNHRWHRLCWGLDRPNLRRLAPDVAAGLARRWNARQPAARQIRSLEMRIVRQRVTPDDDLRYEALLASWPDRSATGSGNLDRLLRLAEAGE